MKRRKERRLQLVAGIVLMTILLLFADLLICGIVMLQKPTTYDPDAQEIMAHLSVENGTYQLDEEEAESLLKHRQFAMLLSQEGKILWSESLPEELRKTYTLQDVARFTRYYLDDYPVRTYVVGQGLLVIGEKTDQVWKYTFEYDVNQLQTLAEMIPLLIVSNIIALVSVPAWIQRRHAKQKEEERTEWIAGVSHDIRTPLAIVLGNAEIIAGSAEETELKQRAEAIEKQGLRLRRLVDNLNFSSKLEFGSGQFEKRRIQISRFLRKTLTEIMNQTEDDRYQFTIKIDEGLQDLTVELNEDLMERTVMNLIYNAIQHNTDGCCIEIRLYKDKKNHVFLEIGDDGRGVSRELLSRLNRKSYGWEPSSGQHGLGLKIVKQVADWHRWKISFAEREQGGLVCTIRLI